ncbi:MAG TPA: molecular chaperone TorD family protein [Candidatus Rubneribacter avistercoris]|nr:molecular chaperone TorD family protein [Candidatus Rubneribacter avistercoris]
MSTRRKLAGSEASGDARCAIATCAALDELTAQLLLAPATDGHRAFFARLNLDDEDDPVCAHPAGREGLSLMRECCRAGEDAGEDASEVAGSSSEALAETANGSSTARAEVASSSSAALARELSNDFTKLFVGPGRKPCPPWSSVYLDGKRLVNGPTAQEVKRVVRSLGLAAPAGNHEPWDHAGYEFLVVAALLNRWCEAADRKTEPAAGKTRGNAGGANAPLGAGRSANGANAPLGAGGNRDDAEDASPADAPANATDASNALTRALDFCERYLAPWMPAFLDDVAAHARTDFYRGFALFARAVLDVNLHEMRRILQGCRKAAA